MEEELTDDKFDSMLGAVARAGGQNIMHLAARRQTRTIEGLPPRHGPEASLKEALREDVVEHVFEVMEMTCSMLKLDELSRSGLSGAGRLVVDDPELVRVRHCRSGEVRERGRRQERRLGREVAGEAGECAARRRGRYDGRLKKR